jgi:hypothetical protein
MRPLGRRKKASWVPIEDRMHHPDMYPPIYIPPPGAILHPDGRPEWTNRQKQGPHPRPSLDSKPNRKKL